MKRCLNCCSDFNGDKWECPSCGFKPIEDSGVLLFSPELNATEEGFNPGVFEKLYSMEKSSFWFRSRNNLIIWAIEKYFGSASNFLEIGCGTGFVLSGIVQNFPQLKCNGSEIHASGLSYAKSRISDVPLWQMDAREIPFRDEFDLIGAFDVLEHIKEDELVLNQAYQSLKPGGGLLLTVPQHPWLWSRSDEVALHERRYTRDDLALKIKNSGFKIIRSTSFLTFLFPVMLLSRLKERFRSSESILESELGLPTSVDRSFEKIMSFERSLIKSGVNLPFGGSIFMIATK